MASVAPAGAVDQASREGRPGVPRARLWLVVGVLAAAFVAVYELAVGHGWGQRLDEAMKAWWLAERSAAEPWAYPLARLLGAPLLAITGVAGVVVVLRRRRPWGLVPLAAIVAGGPLLAVVAKRRLLDRELLAEGTFPVENTLPSGHATAVATAALVLLWLASPARRPPALLAATGLVVAGGTVILLASLHRPSDVAAGFLLAGGWSAAVLAVTGRAWSPPAWRRTLLWVGAAAAGALAAGLVGAAFAVVQERDAGTTSVPVFASGVALAGGTGAAVVLAVAWALEAVGVAPGPHRR